MTGERDWDIGVALLSVYDQDGYLGVQVDVDGSEGGGLSSGADATPVPPNGGAGAYEAISPGGLIHRPMDPVADANGNPNGAQSAQSLNFREGGRVWAFPLGDPRTVAILPTVEKGDTLVFADNGSFVRLVGSGAGIGRITEYTTTDGTLGSQSVYQMVWPDRFGRISPWGQEVFDATGYHLVAGGVRVDMMSMTGVPAPASALGQSYIITSPGNIALDAPAVQLGADGALGHGPVARADLLQAQVIAPIAAALQAVQVQMAAASTALASMAAALAANPSPAGYITFAAAAAPALSAAVTAIGIAGASVSSVAATLQSPVLTPAQTWPSASTAVS